MQQRQQAPAASPTAEQIAAQEANAAEARRVFDARQKKTAVAEQLKNGRPIEPTPPPVSSEAADIAFTEQARRDLAEGPPVTTS